MTDPRAEILLGDEDAGALDAVVDETGTGAGGIVDVIEAVSEIGGDMHPRGPGGEISEARVPAIAEAIGEAGAGDELVDEVNVVAGDGSAEEFDEAAVVATADEGEAVTELREVHVAAKLALENDDVAVANGTAPRRGGEAVTGEVGGCFGDLRERVDVRVFRESVLFEAGKRGVAGDGYGRR